MRKTYEIEQGEQVMETGGRQGVVRIRYPIRKVAALRHVHDSRIQLEGKVLHSREEPFRILRYFGESPRQFASGIGKRFLLDEAFFLCVRSKAQVPKSGHHSARRTDGSVRSRPGNDRPYSHSFRFPEGFFQKDSESSRIRRVTDIPQAIRKKIEILGKKRDDMAFHVQFFRHHL